MTHKSLLSYSVPTRNKLPIDQLDGSDNGFVHMLGGVDIEHLYIGMRVQAVFKEERTGSILDIQYFKPLG